LAEPASRRHAVRLVRVAAALALAALACAGALASRHAECAANPGDRVVLAADASDPDVFVWDEESRLIDYALGQWGDTRSLMIHTLLAHPGTQASVISCVQGVVRSKFSSTTVEKDAVRVRLTSGPYRGRFGWVTSSDIHSAR
jgi:hypothetical protein